MSDNLLIKDANNTTRTIHTIEDSTSAHYNMSIPITVSGAPLFLDQPGNVSVTNSKFDVSVSPTQASIPVSIAGTALVSINGTAKAQLWDGGNNVPLALGADNADALPTSGTANRLKTVALNTWYNRSSGSWDLATGTSLGLLVNANVSLGGSSAIIGKVSVVGNPRVAVYAAGTSITWAFGDDNTDNQSGVATGVPKTVARNYVWDTTGSNWDRWDGRVSVTSILGGVSLGGSNALIGSVSISPNGLNIPVSVANTVNVSANGGRFDVSVSPSQASIPVSIAGGSLAIADNAPVSVRGGLIGLNAGTNLIGSVSISPNGLNIPVSIAGTPTVNIGTVTGNIGVSIAGQTGNIGVSVINPTFNLPVSVHPVTQSGTWNVTVNQPIAAGTNLIGAVSVRQIVSVVPDGTGANFPVSVAGTVVLGAGTAIIGKVSLAGLINGSVSISNIADVSVSPNGLNIPVSIAPNTFPFNTVDVPTSTDGLDMQSIIVSVRTSGYLTKGGAGRLYSISGFNVAATPLYLRVFNKATAPASSDVPVLRLVVPGNTAGAGFVYSVPPGLKFSTGIGWRISGGVADTDTTNPSDKQGYVNLVYK